MRRVNDFFFDALFKIFLSIHYIEIRMIEMSSMGIGSKPCLDIRPSSDQINDRSISVSQLGKGELLSCICFIVGVLMEL